jgi:UDP-3-O-[3-hydroxymyristoyl] glucosamine N-acyltransferase
VILAGQVGVVNHIQVGDGAAIGPQSGIAQSVTPARCYRRAFRLRHTGVAKVMTLLPRLPKLWHAVRGEKKLFEIDKRKGQSSKAMLNVREILKHLPHRYPFCARGPNH